MGFSVSANSADRSAELPAAPEFGAHDTERKIEHPNQNLENIRARRHTQRRVSGNHAPVAAGYAGEARRSITAIRT